MIAEIITNKKGNLELTVTYSEQDHIASYSIPLERVLGVHEIARCCYQYMIDTHSKLSHPNQDYLNAIQSYINDINYMNRSQLGLPPEEFNKP